MEIQNKISRKILVFSNKLVKCTKKLKIPFLMVMAALYVPTLIRLQNDEFRPPEFIVFCFFLTVAIVYLVIYWFLYPKNVKDELRLIK
ncbi:MAG TPA: hypothetical protein VIK86_09095 [Candidatus Paceibacterota bacterium]